MAIDEKNDDVDVDAKKRSIPAVDETTMIRLRSMADEDGKTRVFEISKAAAKLSDLLRNALPGMDDDDDDDDDEEEEEEEEENVKEKKPPVEIEVSRVNGRNLEKAVEYMKRYHQEPMKEIETPMGEKTFEQVLDQVWYREFVADDALGDTHEMCDGLFGVLLAANFLGIKQLFDLCLLRFAYKICGKSQEEIRIILRQSKLTPEELALAKHNHRWMFEKNG